MEIETKRLLLRPLRNDDAPAMAHALNNYEVSRYLTRVASPYSLNDARAFIERQRSFDPRSMVRAITFKCAPDELLGLVAFERNAKDGTFEFGYWLSEACWGMRIMSEATEAMVCHAFSSGTANVLTAGYWNPVSGRLLRSLGFVETHASPSFSLALGKSVLSTRLELTAAMWMDQQKGRAA